MDRQTIFEEYYVDQQIRDDCSLAYFVRSWHNPGVALPFQDALAAHHSAHELNQLSVFDGRRPRRVWPRAG